MKREIIKCGIMCGLQLKAQFIRPVSILAMTRNYRIVEAILNVSEKSIT
jgi:superfamily I DNA/RNA helicase